ncbi:MAG: amidohydrolase family protein [Gemmatimonadaceae bacterium]
MDFEPRGSDLDRRAFLVGLAATTAAATTKSQSGVPAVPIIDSHIHLFDQTRPQGAPYTGGRRPGGAPSVPALPDRYRTLARPLGIVGAIEVEASPWIEDNLWVLEVAQADTIMVGTVGNLEPDKPEFPEYLERYHKNPLFRGIRYGNLWGRDFTKATENPTFINGLKLVAQAGLILDTANPRITLLEAVVRITDQVPDLRVMIDHLPGMEPTDAERPVYERLLTELGKRPQLYVKLSQVAHQVNGQVSFDVSSYRNRLDHLIEVFGEDRIVFGSDWPNSDGVGPVDKVIGVVKEYFSNKPRALQEKYYWKNSVAAYRWVKREPTQPSL